MIEKADVEEILEDESVIATISDKAEDANVKIDLNQSLTNINRDIIYKVVEEEHGNKSKAARRLGIRRSTLWRILRKQE